MKLRILALCALFAGLATMMQAQGQFPSQAPAQASGSFTIKCNPDLVLYQFSTTQTVAAYACTTDATINGVAFKGLNFSQTNQSVNGVTKDWGVIVGTLTNGDMVFFEYQAVAEKTGATTNAAEMSYKIVGGSGIASGLTGSGSCKAVGAKGQGSEQSCAGTYAPR